MRRRPSPPRPTAGFSLVEVIAAVAIFGIGMLAVAGLYAPVTRAVGRVADAEAAARVADAVRARLRAVPFETGLALIQSPAAVQAKDANGAYNPNDGTRYPEVLFGKLDGEVGIYDRASNRRQWYDSRNRVMPNPDKFFEIDLIRQPAVSPPELDATAPAVVYTLRVRWPAFIQVAPGAAVQSAQNSGGPVSFDHGRKQVLYFTGVLER
ncbi:MAG: prepilin-type N-terminal cleavage/methylation domain-containing protein [Verrucomicrobia bacterium]|nr:prepilin-type N-terminal cleavage/methylation domain-containing protein [Verrucomicrobiota bacterium]